MSYTFYSIVVAIVTFISTGMQLSAQVPVLANNGATIVIRPYTPVSVAGNVLQTSGFLEIATAATVSINGDVLVFSGAMTISSEANVFLTGNLTLTAPSAVLHQNSLLHVEGVLSNNGAIMNAGIVEIGK